MIDLIKASVVLLVGFLNLILGIIILTRNPKKIINQTVFVICMSFFIWCQTLYFYEHPIFFSSLFWIQLVYMSAVVYMSTTLLLSFVFPTPAFKPAWKYAAIYNIIYVIFSIWLMYFTKWWVIGVAIDPSKGLQTILHTQGYVLWMSATWVNFLWITINFIIRGKTATGFQKQQIGYLWIGYILFGIAVTVSDGVLPLLWSDTSYFYLSATTNLFFSGLVGYIILKHRFLDIRLVIARSISYTLLLATLGIFYSLFLWLFSNFFTNNIYDFDSLLISTVLSLTMAFTFQSLRTFLESITDKVFYKGQYDTQKLLHVFSQTIASTPTFSNLSYKLLEIFNLEMRISKTFFAIIKDNQLYISQSTKQENTLQISKSQVEQLQSETSCIVFEEIPEGKTKELMRVNNISIIYPLRTNESFLGLLLLGEKKSGEIFFDHDIKALEIIGPEIAVALQNSQRFEQINQFNITLQQEVKTATEELRQANNKLKKLDLLKDEFISIASHDLRSPLSITKGFVWMAVKDIGNSSPKAQDHLSKALESTERSIALVNDMLDVSRIEAGRIELKPDKVNISNLIAKVVEESQTFIDSNKIKLILQTPEKHLVLADTDKIHQVLGNLLNNALKFTPLNGQIKIFTKDINNTIEISIVDNGPGIKPENIKKLFTKFGRLDSDTSLTPIITGTGLGLYICKSIVELSGGKINATSNFGEGSMFTFSLPKA